MSGPVVRLLALLTALLLGTGLLLVPSAAQALPALVADQDPVVSGVPQVGAPLTAIAGGYDADPDTLSYEWDVAGSPVGTDAPIYRPTVADVGGTVTVTVTATRAGYDDAVTTSDPTVAVWGGGRLVGWGDDANGESSVPAGVADQPVSAATGGIFHSVALLADGTVTAFGAGSRGQAVAPPGLSGVVAIAAGTTHSMAVTSDGGLTTWGDDDYTQRDNPDLSGDDIVEAAGGTTHSMVLTADGNVIAWGFNGNGQTTVPPEIQGHVVAISAQSGHSLALTSDGVVHAWGSDSELESDVPPELAGQTVVAIAAGSKDSLALTSAGTVVAWGNDDYGQINVPVGLTDVTSIAAGGNFSMALTADGQVHLWGASNSGQLPLPDDLTGRTVTSIGAGFADAFAIYAALSSATDPVVTGTGQVGDTLTATPGSYDLAPDHVSGAWLRNGTATGATGTTYTLGPDDAGATITYQETATRAGYADGVATSNPVGPIDDATFTTGPTPTISGTAQVGRTLTASSTGTVPGPTLVSYQWYADGRPITGATDPTYTLGTGDVGAEVTVVATAHRLGYTPASGVSDAVGPVTAATSAPGLTLTTTHTQLRRGQSATLTWSSEGASTLTTVGWPEGHGTVAPSGTLTVRPAVGTHVYELDATNASGTTTAQVVITVARAAKRLTVQVPDARHRGQRLTVHARGLAPHEQFTMLVGGTIRAVGRVNAHGRVHRTVVVALHAPLGPTRVQVIGSLLDRAGQDAVRVLPRLRR